MTTPGETIRLEDLDADPYPHYRQLRDEEPCAWVPAANRWLVTRWDDVLEVEKNPETFAAGEHPSLMTRALGLTMLRLDGDAHRRIRRAVEGPLKPNVARDVWAPRFRETAAALLDELAPKGSMEFVSEFADAYHARCLRDLLGLDAADEDLVRWARDLVAGIGNYADDPQVWQRVERSSAEVDAAIETTLASGEVPENTVLAGMLAARGTADELSIDEIRANVKLFLTGGLNEPRDATALLLFALLAHPEQLAAVRADTGLMRVAVEESLRWVSPIGMYPRQTTRPTTLAGVDLPEGAKLGVVVASANRDERHWDDPDRFDVQRPRSKHVAFSSGPHFCVGAWIAREEIGGCALPLVLERLPGIRLAGDDAALIRGWVFRGPQRLRIEWDT